MWERFLVQESERSQVAWLFVLSLLSGIPQIATMTAGTTIVASSFSPENLPYLLLASGGVLALSSAIALLALQHSSPRERVLALSLTLVIGTAAVVLVTRLGENTAVIGGVIYIWSRVENALLAIMLLTSANSLLSPRASRRTLGVATTGQVLTLIGGSALIPIVLRVAGVVDLLWFSLIAHVVVVIHVARSSISDERPYRPRQGVRLPQRRRRRRLRQLISERRLTSSVFALIAAMYVVYYVADATFLSGLGQSFASDAEVATFVARFWLILGVVALVFKLVFTGRLLSRHGFAIGLLAPPVVMAGVFAIGGFFGDALGALIVVVAAKATERVLDSALFLPSYYGLFQGFRPRIQSRNQLVAEALMGQGFASVAGFALVALRQSEDFSLSVTLIVGGVVAVLWFVLAVLGIRRYRASTLAFLLPAEQLSWSDGLPGGDRGPSAAASVLTVNEAPDEQIDEAVIQAGTLELQIRQAMTETPDGEGWVPLVDAFRAEQQRSLVSAAEHLDVRSGSRRLTDSMLRIGSLEGKERAAALDGLERMIEPRWRESIVSVLGSEEGFLVSRALSRLRRDRMNVAAQGSEWTEAVVRASDTERNQLEWERAHSELLLLKQSELFSRFSLEDLADLAADLERTSYRPGEQLISEGETGSSMLVITDGVVSVSRGRTRLATFEPGQSVGELSALFPERRSASVTAATDTSALVVERERLWSFLRDHPSALVTFESVLRERIAERLNAQAEPDFEIEPLDSRRIEPRLARDAIVELEMFRETGEGVLKSVAANVEFATVERGTRLLCVPGELVVVLSGVVDEYCGEYPSLRVYRGSPVGAVAWTGYEGRQVFGVAKRKSRLLRIREATYQTFLADALPLHSVALYGLVTLSRSLSYRSGGSSASRTS